MFTKLSLLQVVVLALTAQAAPIVRIDPVDAGNFPQQAERAILPRGINVPWKWVGPSILGTVTLDHLGFQNPSQEAAGQTPTPATSMPMDAATTSATLIPPPASDKPQDPMPMRPRPGNRPISMDNVGFPFSYFQPKQQRDLTAIDSDPSPRSDAEPGRSDATRHVGRGINIPWRWVGPSIAGTVVLDNMFMTSPPTPIGGPETATTYPAFSNPPATTSLTAAGTSTNPSRVVRNEGAPSQVSHVGADATLRTRGASTSDFESRASPAVMSLSRPTARGVEEVPITAPRKSYQKLVGVGAKVRKVPFKWLGLGVLGGVVLDHLFSPLPRPYFHRQPNLRALDYIDHADVAGSKRSELEARMNLPWKWILGGTAGGFTLDRMLSG
ncbi:hypothetical protein CF327_g5162 [Tilletia walkeri]|uniref:Uncharacterized protein n=1 Tax=Tilletia walkeri TaxID=117179 RepID=A0A8X7N7U5_9BASI|nr:hypothetical protein CF327_g5162 [Tilletia walkeri]KAE8268309.1 hypothetical protein A4X09_0g4043 [Tilletia walkeri]